VSTKMNAGAPFPEISWNAVGDKRVAPATDSGWRLLIVYRGAHCPICKSYLKTLNGMLDDFAGAQITVYGLSADPRERAEKEASEEKWTFPVGYDFTTEQMQTLGVYVSSPRSPEETDRPFSEPAVFFINPSGETQVIDISNAPFARPDLKMLLDGLKFVMSKDYPIRGTA
jgi:peroxiredoxin